MALAMPLVWSDHHRLHEPGGEVWVGVRTPGTEVPERAERIRAAVEAAGAPVVEAEDAPDDIALRFHDPALVAWLRDAWDLWEEAGLGEDPGQDRVVPYLFAHPGLVGELPLIDPAATTARAGRFAFDTMTLIGPGTWQAARGAVDVALTAVGLVTAGAPAAYACCRPPGHHATAGAYGGSCYLNNAAAAAGALRDRGRRPGRRARHRRPPRQRRPVDLLVRSAVSRPARSTSIPAPAGSPISSGSPPSAAGATAPART